MHRWRARWARWFALAVVLVVGVSAPQTSASAAARPSVSVGGYDFDTERPADVVAGSDGNNLVFRFALTTALVDATLRVFLPARTWPQPLTAQQALVNDGSQPGDVVVRVQPGPDGQGCSSDPENAVIPSVDNGAHVHSVTVPHLSCAAGQEVAVRIFGLRAPDAAGSYPFGASITDVTRGTGLTSPQLRVVPTPRERLRVTLPAGTFTYGDPIPVTVTALGPDGRVDRGYRGGVALTTRDEYDCSALGQHEVQDFSATDRGRKTFSITLSTSKSTRIEAYDVGHRAVPGYSRPYQAVDSDDSGISTCPISYH